MMALRKLPLHIQSIFHASVQIRTYKHAVEELVFNALDAKSSSIAIRVNIQEDYIQVVDNGHGVASKDFNILGQRYSTSRYEEPITSKSNLKYGHSGQSLANLIQVSKSVRITSRCLNNMETWTKSFCNGKEEAYSVTASRPSVGTTVEIKGFLYNLSIQKKAVKALQELNKIKTFLEQISLVHCNTSISLRDNFENEVIFKMHKNRNLIQTLTSVTCIETCNIREFQVEKNQYKVTGLIQNNIEESKGYHWIYVNDRFIENSNLHMILNGSLANGVPVKYSTKTKSRNHGDEKSILNNKIPDYFIFIKCPPNDYDIIANPKQSILEFKNLHQVEMLLKKLVKFYMGDINFVKATTIKEPTAPEISNAHEPDTRNKVKQIIKKILGTQQKKITGSALHNGVKGKKINRKAKKPPSLKLKPGNGKFEKERIQGEEVQVQNQPLSNDEEGIQTSFIVPQNIQEAKKKFTNRNSQQNPLKKEKQLSVTRNVPIKKGTKISKEPVLSKFEKETDEVQKRCYILAKKVDQLLGIKKKRKCKIFTNETVHYSNIVRDNKSISIRQKINEIIIHEYLPKLQKVRTDVKQKEILNDIKKSDDLIHPVVNIEERTNIRTNIIPPKPKMSQSLLESCSLGVADTFKSINPGPTYESHGYLRKRLVDPPGENQIIKHKPKQFISKMSRENFASNKTQKNALFKRTIGKNQNVKKRQYKHIKVSTDTVESSYSIHFTETNSRVNKSLNNEPNIGNTYTIAEPNKIITSVSNGSKNTTFATCAFDMCCNHDANRYATANITLQSIQSSKSKNTHTKGTVNTVEGIDNDNKVIFISNSQCSDIGTSDIEPITICEAVINSHDDQDHGDITFIFDSVNNVIERNLSDNNEVRDILQNITYRDTWKGENHNRLNINQRMMKTNQDNNMESNCFNFKNRRRYIPKGLSPIFENCNLKTVCNYELEEDYFEKTVYDKFAKSVQKHSKIFEPKIRDVTEAATKDIQRVDNKLSKDNARLIFNGESLKQATVLGQVDSKFIATIMKGQSHGFDNECLVLFDQHAVHERIRLEQHLSEYISEGQWKSVSLDDVSLLLTKDEMLYLHNYRDKFQQLGFQWSIASDTQVVVNAIPEAILGKHPRQVDVVLKAVKSLLKEEISIIREQGGCASLYPKSIMDLVFSEACRYAVMFGDKLSARECTSLVDALSRCGTPFQCAHGRPAMAVIVVVARETRPYTINFAKVEQFRRIQKSLINRT